MSASNKVISGEYAGKKIMQAMGLNLVIIQTGIFKSINIDKNSVKEYEVIDEETRKNAVSAVGRAFVGGAILGPIGWLAALSAKRKGVHTIAIEFNNGKKSLIEVDEKIYKALQISLF